MVPFVLNKPKPTGLSEWFSLLLELLTSVFWSTSRKHTWSFVVSCVRKRSPNGYITTSQLLMFADDTKCFSGISYALDPITLIHSQQ